MTSAVTVGPAAPPEWEAVAHLLFQHLPPGAREARAAEVVRLFQRGEIEATGILAAHHRDGLCGALVCVPLRGASALLWPPQAVPGPLQVEVEDRLVRHALAWVRDRGARLAQALLTPEEVFLAAPLGRHGFNHMTSLLYLRRALHAPAAGAPVDPSARPRLQYQTYSQDPPLFHKTLLRTYEGTLDCPELNGVRDVADIIDGHQAQGSWDPQRWWIALRGGRPVGVLLLTDVSDWQGWDVSYLGVVPEARGRGVGRQLTMLAIRAASAAGVGQLTLAVDARNHPARRLYARTGFELCERREVFLAFLHGPNVVV